ncbi:hypothetical protein DFQ04_3432 [Algoriphagus boseongensis]|uniref:UbiA prenyltransferase family protein n=1 Tax=Algoriphagus boseongensis TaxID=1442587 RepID=A0A4R6T1Q7_9BACT|nr:hypothetical protein [Algoriphagus boseongensis]TDQ13708.1 hypothetical protein DFQ04_3432 [Algoriphagus boseongensis]
MKQLKSLWIHLTWLSIDVVLGAIAGLLFFFKLFRVNLDPNIFLLLGLAVWAIYTADHLLDARNAKELITSRHKFHQKFQSVLLIALGLVVAFGLVYAYLVLGWSREFYLSLIFGATIFLTMVSLRKAGRLAGILKEISTSIFYVLGVAWIPLLRADSLDITWQSLTLLLFYILLAFLNLLMLSFLDRKEDQVQGFVSAASIVEPDKLILGIRRLSFLIIFGSFASFILFSSFYRPYACLILMMTFMHFFSFFNPKLSAHTKRIRTEASFFLPFLLLAL